MLECCLILAGDRAMPATIHAMPTPAAPSRLAQLIARLAPNQGYTKSAYDGVTFVHTNRAFPRMPALYEPSICIVAQGRKRAFHGRDTFVFDAQHVLAVAIPLPFEVETHATEDEPLLGLAIRVDPTLTAELALAVDEADGTAPPPPASMLATPMDARLSDALVRLCEALLSPLESTLLAPAIVREITYRVLTGEQGAALRAALTHGGPFGRIAKALRRIHAQYERDLDVATLASEASMSVAAFHARFKAVTDTSPIQYIKSIRLHQARLLMIRSQLTAAAAASRVGYESASQFSREFKRLFGNSPAEETKRLQQVFSLSQPLPFARSA